MEKDFIKEIIGSKIDFFLTVSLVVCFFFLLTIRVFGLAVDGIEVPSYLLGLPIAPLCFRAIVKLFCGG